MHSLTLANGITAGRLFFFGLFVVFVWRGLLIAALLAFIGAWALDALDGSIARLFHQRTRVGFVLDKVVDRVVIIGGVVTLLVGGVLPDAAVFLLTKDIALLPLITVQWFSDRRIGGSGLIGKVVMGLQGGAIVWLLLGLPAQLVVIAFVAVVGGVGGAVHLYRVAYRY